MRKRSNAEQTMIRNYSFWCRPLRIPDEFWRVATAMRLAWNDVVELSISLMCELRKIEEEANMPALQEEMKRIYKEWLKTKKRKNPEELKILRSAIREIRKRQYPIWDQYRKDGFKAAKARDCNWEQANDTIDRAIAGLRVGRTLKKQDELIHMQVPHQFTVPIRINQMGSGRGWRIKHDEVHQAAYESNDTVSRYQRCTVVEFGLTPLESVTLRVNFHRQIPGEALIRMVRLCAVKIPLRGIQWSLLFCCEVPRPEKRNDSSAAGVYVGWTRVGDEIRVATVVGNDGRITELRLPLNMANHADRRNQKQVQTYPDLMKLKERYMSEEDHDRRLRFREIYRTIWRRWTARRRWLYRNFTSWLCRNYAVLVFVPLEVKKLAEDKEKAGSLHGADRNRQWAAPGELQQYVLVSAEDHGCTVTDDIGDHFSQTYPGSKDLAGLRKSLEAHSRQLFAPHWNKSDHKVLDNSELQMQST